MTRRLQGQPQRLRQAFQPIREAVGNKRGGIPIAGLRAVRRIEQVTAW